MRYRYLSLLALALGLFVSGCVTPFYKACLDAAKDPQGEFKYTEDRAAVACSSKEILAHAHPHLIMYDKEKGTWNLNPNGVLTEDVEKVMRDQAGSLNSLLSYKNQEDANFIDFFTGFRAGLEKEEAITLENLRRLSYVRTYNQFTDLVGELPQQMHAKDLTYFFPAGRKFYSMRVLYPRRSLKGILFTAEYLEVAKRDGTLKLVDTFDVANIQDFARKTPSLYDPNDFTWEKHERGWSVKAYKVLPDQEKPNDSIIHYLEIFRMRKGGQGIESQPAVRGFLASGGSKVTVFVVDHDREGGSGYGSPDSVFQSSIVDITGTHDIFFNSVLREKLLLALYEANDNKLRERPDRKKPEEKLIYTSIVKLGQASIDMWEKGTWSVPFDHKSLTPNLELIYDIAKTPEEKRLEEREKLKKIKAVKREFKQEGKIVMIEYWALKDEFSERNVVSAFAGVDALTIRRKNGREEKGEVGYFGKRIVTLDYQFGGRWFRLMDEDGDGIFEKRRSISNPVPDTKPSGMDIGM